MHKMGLFFYIGIIRGLYIKKWVNGVDSSFIRFSFAEPTPNILCKEGKSYETKLYMA